MKRVLIVDDQEGWRVFNSQAIKEVLGNDTIIDFADCAQEAYTKLLDKFLNPYEYIITDLQMEDDFAPKLAGEWLIEQTKSIAPYYNAKIIIVSASPKIKLISESLNVDYIQKNTALLSIETYKEILIK